MKDIVNNWRRFRNPDLSGIIDKRLHEALSRRQFLTGGAAAGLLYALMQTDFFNQLSDEEQDKLIEMSPEELAQLEIDDPEYAEAVRNLQNEFGIVDKEATLKDKYEGLSSSEIKEIQLQSIGALMIAPAELMDGRQWQLAPTRQSQTSGYYTYVSELDLELIAETNPEITKAIDAAYEFYSSFGLTRLQKYVYGQPEFFSYTSQAEANSGKVFDTIESDRQQKNYLTGEMENIKFRKLPLAWTVAQKTLLDQISFMESELAEAQNDEEVEAILEKYGVGTEWGQGYSKTSKYDVVKKLRTIGGNALDHMSNPVDIPGKHSNK